MPLRHAEAHWSGGLKAGHGVMQAGQEISGAPYSFGSRFQESQGSNPEELLGAAEAGCYSMAFSQLLEQEGHSPRNIDASADVHLDPKDGGFKITAIDLNVEAVVPGIDNKTFQSLAEKARSNCPVSQAMSGLKINLNARLLKGA